MIKINQLSISFDARPIFDGLNFEIQDGERLAIVGNNGCGKSTLMNIIAGKIEPDKGNVLMPDYESISYMEQVEDTIKESTLSGGEMTKVRIREAFSNYSQILILDEPTNHLDYKGILWLKKMIDNYFGTVIIVSHDRYLMDLVCTSVYEIDKGKGYLFKGNYSDYKAEKEHLRKTQEAAYEKQEKTKEKIQEDIEQLKKWSNKAHKESRKKGLATGNKLGSKEYFRKKAKKKDAAIKSKIKRLEKIETKGLDKPEEELSIKFAFNREARKLTHLIVLEEVEKAYGRKMLFSDVSLTVKRGEHIALLGLNGTGKTTLIQLIRGQIKPDKGRIRVNRNISIGYLSQEVLDLNEDQTVLESLGFYNKQEMTVARIQLNNLGIGKEMVKQKIATLSMGERTRIKLAKIILSSYDILILDEPTNHLDVATRETLEKALMNYEGTLLIVSHDYYMLSRLCEDTFLLENEKLIRTYDKPQAYLDSMVENVEI